ncbi:ABC transporter ATP-binding protein [Listeria newyorkensis]|uniref:ABC transporter ATP-binding protein n=1 Tax=Listeria newyorkensis TaxID=1497681 RepID=A0ABX4XIB7_9LIST|nr:MULTISPECIES: ABC-F family ATP-binding cassette domain-containing protein [Listeria]KGL46088.1 ABC transporter ATP-binding protein [Listeriaceae bacterium FSL A5-0209]KGL46773.1 ABC transporter ATP-binding protein [Listeria newyorkensis]PNP87481.1 ABC transporter ATP-binding protein [Listeria newyorkensis]RQW66748.1 ABC transporter ATP-binding protein [Listeria sp. SHR_NRA_18]WAO20514.1 ABC-F family ATP-binding cassette domain-containing protein [Listeria newyorkensis]
MLILEINDVKKEIADRVLFEIPHVMANRGERIGIVGRNGLGKTTLLEMMAGVTTPDQGIVTRNGTTGYLPQILPEDAKLSGGEKTRKAVQRILAEQPNLLFADEPTSNLDVDSVKHLERQWKRYAGTLFVISHDRMFLDAICTTIWELDQARITVYPGNYSAYEAAKQAERDKAEAGYEQYQAKKRKLEESQQHHEKTAQGLRKPNKRFSSRQIRAAKPGKGVQEKKQHKTIKALEQRIDRLERVDKPFHQKAIKIMLPEQNQIKQGNTVIRVNQLSTRVGKRVLFSDATFSLKSGEKVALIGKNASGKTTFLRQIMQSNEAIKRGDKVKIAYFDQQLKQVDLTKTLWENIQAVSIHDDQMNRDCLGSLQFVAADLAKDTTVLSGGERVKLALAMLLLSDANVLILDEPTNYLDINAMKALESLISGYSGTVLFVSHDRTFVRKVATSLLVLEEEKLTLFDGTYADWENAKKTVETRVEEDKLLLEMEMSAIAAKLMEPRLTATEKAELEKRYQEVVAKRK